VWQSPRMIIFKEAFRQYLHTQSLYSIDGFQCVKMIYITVFVRCFLHCKFVYFVHLWLVPHPTAYMTHLHGMYVCWNVRMCIVMYVHIYIYIYTHTYVHTLQWLMWNIKLVTTYNILEVNYFSSGFFLHKHCVGKPQNTENKYWPCAANLWCSLY